MTDHQNLIDLIDQLKTMKERNALLLQRLYDNFKVHTQVEERIFYPAMKEIEPELSEKSADEHQEMDRLVEEVIITRDRKGLEVLLGEINTLAQIFQRHVQQEEAKLFPKAEDHLGDKLDKLGAQIENLKIDLRTTQYGMAA
jgi:hemerythrin-like domain-containing protein